MANVTISTIAVDLGASVESIINDDVTNLTANNKRDIDNVIKEAAAQQEAVIAAQAAKDQHELTKAKQLETLYQDLLTASAATDTSYLSSQAILAVCAPEMPNMISFVGRMRNWLKSTGKQQKLTSIKKGKEQGYRLD